MCAAWWALRFPATYVSPGFSYIQATLDYELQRETAGTSLYTCVTQDTTPGWYHYGPLQTPGQRVRGSVVGTGLSSDRF